jgi:hypothetical protein
MTAKTIVIEVKAETQNGEPWSPQTNAHLSFLIAERLKGLHYEIKEIRE